ncbi:uncharacterized protein LOC119680678 [Teleopsis dalmanni]|uniref:uncharacterized protein LOC119680678 n=1 Tax=Teleopsis dalmanni TaxID=139649 RepID=UPI0018CDF9BE|nr:uncharacterized protein LOC119680678 [Teleopsis dalmanni]XP_037949544.1 uncharacterized protein LOC119680678 [Teleopsis dalmanni]XP_037949545.1 uncharacterized protein LOC119680678 [Teleopsis dalmanni]
MLPTKQTTVALALAAVFLCCSIGQTQAQENAQLQIPPSLVECYNTSYFMNRDNRLPSNIGTLISLIEKVENSYNYNQDIRQLAISLIHRFRQDGIQRAPNIVASPGVIPYSPTGFQFSKFRILLQRLIPGNAYNFPNNSLSVEERCSLHFMLSSSFDTRQRGDENQVCGKLSQYRAQRLPRAAPAQEQNNFIGDVELLETFGAKNKRRVVPQGKLRENVNINAKSFDYDWGYADPNFGYSSGDNAVSQCPVENGVIWTPWGTVAAGTLIAGIAAGLEQQSVQLRTLLALARRQGGPNLPQTTTVAIDNRWAATLAGDLAEVALLQVPSSSSETASVGANGAWNNTVMPKWYFLSQRQNMEMTDAEIRGGLDGLIIAMNIVNWRTQAPSLKLSQLLRMYYSMDGVLSSGIMACNRKDNFPTFAPLNTMIAQTSAFAQVLDREMQLRVTLSATAIANFSNLAANALESYIPQYLNDVSCSVSNALPQDISSSITAMTNIYVFLDTSWQYGNIVDYLVYILERLNINPYASSVTLLAAADCSVIVNTTNNIADVYENWNVTTHSMFNPGFNLPNILQTLQNLTQAYMNAEQTNSSVGGRSMVALMMPNQATVNSGDSSYSTTQLLYMSEQIPDLHYIYYSGGTSNRFSSFVNDPNQDLFSLTIGSQPSVSSGPVVNRIKKVPRRIINPNCGSNWYSNSGTNNYKMTQYARPGVINFYRMVPNYYYGAASGRYVNIQPQSSMQFTVCSSRSTVLPMQNSTNSGSNQNCVQISGSSSPYSYDLSNACDGYYTIHQCPSLYLSVQAMNVTNSYTVSCTDAACQTPDQLQYSITVANLGCYSSASGVFASFITITLAYFLLQFFK